MWFGALYLPALARFFHLQNDDISKLFLRPPSSLILGTSILSWIYTKFMVQIISLCLINSFHQS